MTHKCIPSVEGCSPHWSGALHVVAHLLVPLRKALVNYALTSSSSSSNGKNDGDDDLLESLTLIALGRFFKELVQKPSADQSHKIKNKSQGQNKSDRGATAKKDDNEDMGDDNDNDGGSDDNGNGNDNGNDNGDGGSDDDGDSDDGSDDDGDSDDDEDDETPESIDAGQVCRALEKQLKAMHIYRKEKEAERSKSKDKTKDKRAGQMLQMSKHMSLRGSDMKVALAPTIEESDGDDGNESGDGSRQKKKKEGKTESENENEGALDPIMDSLLPDDATAAMQLLLDIIFHCTRRAMSRNSPIMHTWTALLDSVGLGVLADVRITSRRLVLPGVVQSKNQSQGHILQRTKRETRVLACPLILPGTYQSVTEGMQRYTSKRPLDQGEQAWDEESFVPDFEVKIPLLEPLPSVGKDADSNSTFNHPPTDRWSTVQTVCFRQLPAFLFLGLRRFEKKQNDSKDSTNDEGSEKRKMINLRVEVPLDLDVSKFCDSTPGSSPRKPRSKPTEKPTPTRFTLAGGILWDDGSYVTILKNPEALAGVGTPSKTNANASAAKENDRDSDASEDSAAYTWKLLESDDIIPMTEADALEFLAGDGTEDGVFGTMLVYMSKDDAVTSQMTSLLSKLVLAGVSADRTMFRQYHGGGRDVPDLRSSISEDSSHYYYEEDVEGSDDEYEYIEEIIED